LLRSNHSTFNVKDALKEIKEKAFVMLKTNFLGDIRSIDGYYKKLGNEIKNQSKSVIVEVEKKSEV
jgi:hypothetical protein